jgi:hypothetical protein
VGYAVDVHGTTLYIDKRAPLVAFASPEGAALAGAARQHAASHNGNGHVASNGNGLGNGGGLPLPVDAAAAAASGSTASSGEPALQAT